MHEELSEELSNFRQRGQTWELEVGTEVELLFDQDYSGRWISGTVVEFGRDVKLNRRLAIVKSHEPATISYLKEPREWFAILTGPYNLTPDCKPEWSGEFLATLEEPWRGQELYEGPLHIDKGSLNVPGADHDFMTRSPYIPPTWATKTDETVLEVVSAADHDDYMAAFDRIKDTATEPVDSLRLPFRSWQTMRSIYKLFDGFETGRTFLAIQDWCPPAIGRAMELEFFGWRDPGLGRLKFIWSHTEKYKLIQVMHSMSINEWPSVAVNEGGMLVTCGPKESLDFVTVDPVQNIKWPMKSFAHYARYLIDAKPLFGLIDQRRAV